MAVERLKCRAFTLLAIDLDLYECTVCQWAAKVNGFFGQALPTEHAKILR